jgi:hypothetical protein
MGGLGCRYRTVAATLLLLRVRSVLWFELSLGSQIRRAATGL